MAYFSKTEKEPLISEAFDEASSCFNEEIKKELWSIENDNDVRNISIENGISLLLKQSPCFLNTLSGSILADYANCLNIQVLKDPELINLQQTLKSDTELRSTDDYFDPFIRNTIKIMRAINTMIVSLGPKANSNSSTFYAAVNTLFLEECEVGMYLQVIHWGLFSSQMPNIEEDECLLEITVPKGCFNALPIIVGDGFQEEGFVLLPPYTIFLVENVEIDFEKLEWKLKVGKDNKGFCLYTRSNADKRTLFP